jgi:aminoglycoside phosphotransferase (APT) family kinase protein
MYGDMNRVVAALHTVDFAAVGLADYGRTESFFERQIRRWTNQYNASVTEPIDAMDRLIEWLPKHIPPDDRTTLFHGDLRVDNMIFHPTQPRVIALLDWELSTLGHPVADLAYHALPWRLTSGQFRGMAERSPLPDGIPSEHDYLRDYVLRTGTPLQPDLFEFCVAYSLFRLTAILQGIYKRSLDGTASGTDARETGRKARPIAEVAWSQVKSYFGETS